MNLPKKELENLINNDKYLDFIYYYIKLYILFIFFEYNGKEEYNDFIHLYNYLEEFLNN